MIDAILAIPYRYEAQHAAFLVLALLAWRYGGWPERWSTWTMLAMVVADRIYHAFDGPVPAYERVDLWHMSLDVGALVSLVLLAVWANRLYPLVVAALQIISTLTHLARGSLQDGFTPLAYAILNVAPSYFQLLACAVGLALHVRRRARIGPYPDWRTGA